MPSLGVTREELLNDIRGEEVRIPDLRPLFAAWPHEVNPNQDAVTRVVHRILEEHSTTENVEKKLKMANVSYLLSSWYPYADAQTLEDMAYFLCWMYLVDDTIIDEYSRPGQDNAEIFDKHLTELLEFCHTSLGLDPDPNKPQPTSDHPAIDSFRGTGAALCRRYTTVQRQKFYDACAVTMEGYRVEQRMRMAGEVPTVEEYWAYRDGACCMHMCVALIELGIGSSLPASVLNSPEMNDLWFETSCANWLTNDVLSAKKELKEEYVENIVPLCAIPSRKCQDGLDRSVQYIEEHLALFEKKARALEERFGGLAEMSEEVEGGDGGGGGKGRGKVNGAAGEGEGGGEGRWHGRVGPAASMSVGDQVKLFVRSCRLHAAGSLAWRYV